MPDRGDSAGMPRTVLFGCGKRGREFYNELDPDFDRIIAFADNNSQLWGTQLFGKPVIPPESILELGDVAVVICVWKGFDEISRQLNALGIVGLSTSQYKWRRKSPLQFVELLREIDNLRVAQSEASGREKNGKYLVISGGGYPSEGVPNTHRFTHERVLQYQKSGLDVEVFSFKGDASVPEQYTYQGVRVCQGGIADLQEHLQANKYEKLLLHFVSRNMLYAIQWAGVLDTPMIVWCHGNDVLPWYRCWFNYSETELAENRYKLEFLNDEKRLILERMFKCSKMYFVFVSDWEMTRCVRFVGSFPRSFSIIHNHIDCEGFSAPEKCPEDRLRILSIKNHATRMYANDLTAKSVLELSNRSWFHELTFDLYGQGSLLEENFEELKRRSFPNVHIHETFLDQAGMQEAFHRHGIFLSPTRNDTQGVSTGEAMAAGLVPVTTRVAAVPEFVEDDCGALFEFDNYWMMAEEIEYLYYHPEEFLRKSKKAVERVRKQCGYENTIQRELDLILE